MADSSIDPRARRPACPGHPSLARGVRRSGFCSGDTTQTVAETWHGLLQSDVKRCVHVMGLEAKSFSACKISVVAESEITSIFFSQAYLVCFARSIAGRRCFHSIRARATGRTAAARNSGEPGSEEAEPSPAEK